MLTYPFIAALIKWAGIAYLLFIAWQLARPACDTQRLESYRLEAAFVLAVRRLSVRQSESMDARCGYRRIVHGEQCDRRPYRNYCYCVFDRCIGSLVTWAWVGAALRTWLGIGSRMRTFNVAMGMLLAATALWLAML